MQKLTEEEVIEKYAHIVGSTSRRFSFLADYEDLKSEGNIAAVLATRNYDSSKGVPFGPYITRQIQYAIQDKAKRMSSEFHIPHKTNALYHMIRIRSLEQEKPERISELLGKPINEVELALLVHSRLRVASIDTALAGTENEISSFYPMIEDYSVLPVREFEKSLNAKQCKILNMLYAERSQTFIGKELGISQSQVGREVQKLRRKYTEWSGMG